MGDHFNCQLRSKCDCGFEDPSLCFGFRLLHGEHGETGIWSRRNVPNNYYDLNIDDLPRINPGVTEERIRGYVDDVVGFVNRGKGIFMYSEPTVENPLGTGNGKTTSAIVVLNEYVRDTIYNHLHNDDDFDDVLPVFMSFPSFQTLYNDMYRGTSGMTSLAVMKYMALKERLMTAKLVVLDDMAVRNCSEAFLNEIYEVIDCRAGNNLATIITSNVPIDSLTEIYGERITSRIYQMCRPLVFQDIDHRRRNWI